MISGLVISSRFSPLMTVSQASASMLTRCMIRVSSNYIYTSTIAIGSGCITNV